MKPLKPTPPRVIPRVLQFMIFLSNRGGADAIAAFERRLGHYLAGAGFGWKFRGSSLYVGSGDTAIGPLERSLLLSWLAAQQEVVMVRVVRAEGAHAPL